MSCEPLSDVLPHLLARDAFAAMGATVLVGQADDLLARATAKSS